MIGRNNIFNIRSSVSQWQGLDGSERGFCSFVSMDYAVRAWYVTMRTYARKYNCRSIRSIVSRFAPATENNTTAYIQFCVRTTGFSPDYVLLFNEDYDLLADAMARMESGVHKSVSFYRDVRLKFNILVVPV